MADEHLASVSPRVPASRILFPQVMHVSETLRESLVLFVAAITCGTHNYQHCMKENMFVFPFRNNQPRKTIPLFCVTTLLETQY